VEAKKKVEEEATVKSYAKTTHVQSISTKEEDPVIEKKKIKTKKMHKKKEDATEKKIKTNEAKAKDKVDVVVETTKTKSIEKENVQKEAKEMTII
jgi:hypothetical protein